MAAALAVLADGGYAGDAAKAAGISRALLFEWKRDDRSFSARWAEAIDISIEKAEAELYRRGVLGWREPVFGKTPDGVTGVVGAITKYSDRALELFMKAKRPSEYRENPKVAVAAEVQVGDARARFIALLDGAADALAETGEGGEVIGPGA